MLAQIASALLAGGVFSLAQGERPAIAAMCGGFVVAAGTAAMAAISLGGHVADGGTMLSRMLVGMLLKWIVVLGGVLLLMLHWHLPAPAVLIGMAVALLINLIALKRF